MSEELKPCSCGSTDTSIGYESPQGYWVECGDCGRQTEKSHGRDLAIAAWSRRAQPAEAEGVDFGFDDRSVKVSQEAYSIFLEREQHHLAALSAVTSERDRLLQEKGDPAGSFEKCMQAMRDRDEHAKTIDQLRAEVEGLREDAERWRYVSLQGDDTHWLNLLRVDLEDFGGNINAAVDALIDGEAPAMAAKEA